MTDSNESNETVTCDVFVSETERKRALSHEVSHEVSASADLPPSLVSYFEASRSRAAECEKLITEDVEDLMNLATELNENTLKPNQQDRGNEEASCVLPETEAPARVTASPRDEDETETDDYGEKRKHSTSRLSEFSLTKEEIKENNEHQQAHKEKRRFEELKKEDEIRQRENDFQMELKKLMEAEKLHQIELQLMEKRAQEKLDQELLLQQELINNIQKQVEEQRRMIAEELKRMKKEEDKKRKEEEEEGRKKIEEEKIRREIRRKKMEEENKQILEKRAEEERRLKEEQRKREEEEERREREEVRIKMEEEKRKREEEDRKRREKEIMKREMQRRRMEEEMRRKKEEDRKITEELRTKEEEEEEKTKREEEKSKVEEEMTKNKVETKTDKCNEKIWLEEEKTSQMEQMEGERNAKKMENKSNLKVQKEEEKAGKREEGKTNEDDIRKEKKPEDARRETMTTDEQKGKREEEKQKTVDGTHFSEDRNKIRKNNVIRTEEKKLIQEEWRKRQEEENDNEEIRSSEEKEHEAKIRKVEDNRTRTERESEQEQMKEEVIETTENLKAEGRWHEKEEESKIMQEEMETRSNDLQEKTHRSSGPETLTSVTSLTSQLEDGPRSSGLEAPVTERQDAAVQLRSSGPSSPLSPREQKRLSWTSGCTSWCKLSLQNRRKQNGPPRGGRRRRPRTGGVPAPGPDALLQAAGGGSVQQVTSVTLEDRPGCSAASLALCSHLQSLTLRRCGLTSLEGVSHLSQLCYIDVTENHISFVDCEGMTSLRVLRLAHNKLTSIHGLRGANNLDELELSHNNITRIAGLESMKRLQRLSVDHNQLISTKGLRDVYTLLHLNCSHNHLADVEGLENNALLRTLDLSSNSLPEPPALDNHVLLTELHLDDNSISSLQALAAACWLPLMHTLSVAQNRITQLPSMSDFVSLANLDLQFNCMSELHNVCESLEGCVSLQRVHLRGNPLQQENGWRSTLQKALPGLRAVDDQQTDGLLSPPAVQQISSASDTFLKFCQTQLQQMNDLLQQHSRELSEASSPLDAVKSLCRHFTETLKLAEDQRFAHECGDVTASEGRTHVQSSTATKLIEDAQTESSETAPAVGSSGIHDNGPGTSEAVWLQSSDAGTKETGLHSLSEKRTTSSSYVRTAALSKQDLDLKNSAARVIQRQWRTCRQNHGDMSRHPLAASGHGAHPEPGPPCGPHSVLDQHSAAAAIQASWRGFAVRRRLASALAAVTFPSTTEDHAFEEDDVDEFVFDEAAELENLWTLQLSDEWLSRREPVSEQPPSVKFPGPLPEPQNTHTTPPVWRPKQAWAPEEVAPGGRASPESCHRKSPASSSVLSGISERSEKILEEWGFADSHTALQMLKRAHNMKWKQQLKRKHKDPPVGSALFYQLVPVEGGNRAAPRSSRHRRGALCGTETVKQESAEQRLHGQCDRSSESARFLPTLSSDVLNGGRVQLVADPGFSERRRASGQRATSASCALQHSSAPRTSLGRAKSDASSPNGGAAAPRVKERISFRDGAVRLSGGWGGGRKRSSLH